MMRRFVFGLFLSLILFSCKDDEGEQYSATPAPLDTPDLFQSLLSSPLIPETNPQTVEGIALGRKLFYDPILSGDGTQACANCHGSQNTFTDPLRFSIGIDGIAGNRNSMPLFNMAWNFNEKFFWDGRASTLEEQVFDPIENPIEMHNTSENAVASLQATIEYPEMFASAFGTPTINRTLVSKAIAQFERTLISANSKFDQHLQGTATLTVSEANGLAIFMDETKGDCFHCHGNPNSPLWTDNAFHNNGLDDVFTDRGLGEFTGDPRDFGLFKSPSIRNLAYSAPYMHDGRFNTLDEVINHYSDGLIFSPTIDPLMKTIAQGGVQLTQTDKDDLKAFLLSLSDPSFLNNPDFQNPN
jgi:cytochrome c peroxidase